MITSQCTIRAVETFRHPNGGGRIVGIEAAVGSDCFADSDSLIEGRTFISHGSRIVKSSLKDTHASFANITESAVVGSHIAGGIIRSSGIVNAVVRGTKKRLANVQNSLLSGKLVVEGCRIQNVELDGPYLLHHDYAQTPRHLLLDDGHGLRLGIVECKPGYANIGCACRTIKHWIDHKESLRRYFTREQGWAGPEVNTIHELFEEWRRVRLAA